MIKPLLVYPRLVFYFSLVFTCLSLPMQAQEDIRTLSPVSVTATRSLEGEETALRNLHIITAKDIEQMPVTTADELLRYMTGVEIQSRQGFGVQSDISIRGTTFNQSVVLVDGMRINDPLTGHFNGQIPVPLSAIERVEVLTGASSGLYGPDAIGGVIHIITKLGEEVRKGNTTSEDGLQEAHVQLDYGQHNTWRSEGFGLYKKGRFTASISGFVNHSQGEELTTLYPQSETDSTYASDFLVGNILAQIGYKTKSGWRLQAQGAWEKRDFNARYFYTISPFDESRENIDGWWAQANANYRKNRNDLQLQFAFRQNEDVFAFNPAFPANEHKTRNYNLQGIYHYNATENLRITAGLQGDFRTVESTDRGNHEDGHVGLFSALLWEPLEGLTLQPVFRIDYDSQYDLQTAPMLNVSYQRKAFTFHSSIGRNYRSADFTERFVSYNLEELSPGRNLGNPAVQPEIVLAYEGGVSVQPIKEVTGGLTFFGRSANDLIDYVVTQGSAIDVPGGPLLTPNENYFFANNVASLRTIGLEGYLRWNHTFKQGINFRGNLGYLWAKPKLESGVQSKYLSSQANHLVNGRATVTYKGYSATVSAIWKQRLAEQAPIPEAFVTADYTVINLRQQYIHKPTGIGFHLSFFNLFNEQYSDVLGAQMPGLRVMGGLFWKGGKRLKQGQ